jgi:hypothetical protein
MFTLEDISSLGKWQSRTEVKIAENWTIYLCSPSAWSRIHEEGRPFQEPPPLASIILGLDVA